MIGFHVCRRCAKIITPFSKFAIFIYSDPFSNKIKDAYICSGCEKSVSDESMRMAKEMGLEGF